MDPRNDIQEFLTSRRARLTPEDVGLPSYGDRRRVRGLRREEVAMLAGVSVDYYARLERGRLAGASDAVLDALAAALRLDGAEYQHLRDLALAAGPVPPRLRRRAKTEADAGLRPAVTSILTGLVGVPAYVRNARGDILAANALCRALYDGVLDADRLPVNLARFLFLDPQARTFFREWDAVADDLVGAMRLHAGKDPRNRPLSDLVGELSTRSDEFVRRWARQDVRIHRTARKRLRNSIVGDIELTGDALELAGDDLVLIAYTAEPGSPAAEQLAVLASWATTNTQSRDRDETHHV